MHTPTFRSVIGSFRLLRRRVVEVGAPGIALWADTGEKAARAVASRVRALAHADEVADLEAAQHIAAGVAGLKDGRVDAADLEHFRRAERLTKRSAELAHDAGEGVAL